LKARLSIPDLPSVKLVKNQISTSLAIINFVQSQWDAYRPGIALMKTNNWPFIPMFQPVLAGYWFFSISGGPVIIKKTKLIFKQVSFYFLKSDFWDLHGINIRQGSVNQVINIIWFSKGKNRLVCIRAGYCNNLFENRPMQCLGRLLSWKFYTFY
jgi:hypothetical protein